MRATAPQSPDEVRLEDHVLLAHRTINSHGWDRLGVDRDDLMQAALLAMDRARRTWDPARSSWSTYATWWLRNHCGRLVENTASTVRVPVYQQALRRKRGEYRRAVVHSLDAPIPGGDSDGATCLDRLESPEPEPEPQQVLEQLIAACPALLERERTVLLIRARGGILDEAGAAIGGRTRERARQVEKAGVAKLRAYVAERPRNPVAEE